LTTNSTSISGLTSGTGYEFQVVDGCLAATGGGVFYDTLSAWSAKKTFTTP